MAPGEDSLEEEMATHSSVLAWEIPWIEEPDGLQSKGLGRVRDTWHTHTRTDTHTHAQTHTQMHTHTHTHTHTDQ